MLVYGGYINLDCSRITKECTLLLSTARKIDLFYRKISFQDALLGHIAQSHFSDTQISESA